MKGYDFAARLGAGVLIVLLVGPLLALVGSVHFADLAAATSSSRFGEAVWLSLWTSSVSVVLVVLGGTPLSWTLARTRHRFAALLRGVVDLGVVLPPAVVGVALLLLFGRTGALAPLWQWVGWSPSFTAVAVVLAQVTVAAPLYVQSATAGFSAVDTDLLDVARSLGASRARTFFRVAVPLAAPGLIAGTALAWARALGEFGATLLFAGNLGGVTQTLPLAIYEALESDIGTATALATVLVVVAVTLLLTWRWGTRRVGALI